MTWTRHENGAGATPTFDRRGGSTQLYYTHLYMYTDRCWT